MSHVPKWNRSNVVSFAVCIMLMAVPALYNGFPIMNSDTGTYINSGQKLYIPVDRPLAYGLSIRLAGLGFTLWGAVIAQSLLIVFFLRLLMRHCLGPRYNNYHLVALVIALTLLTSAPWFCSQLMPDIYTAILLLAILSQLYIPLKSLQKAFVWLIIFGSLLMHNSHPLMLMLFSAIILFYAFLRNKTLVKPGLLFLSISIAALLTLSTMNKIAGFGFKPSPSTGVFLMGRLVEEGIMDKFLKEECPSHEYALCPVKDQLPDRTWDFMWNPGSALYETGGWEKNEAEYLAIEKKIFTRPQYLSLFAFKSAQATFRQLIQVEVADGFPSLLEGSSPYAQIQAYYPYELKEYRAGMQSTGRLPLTFFNIVISLAFILLIFGATFAAGIQNIKAPAVNWRGLFVAATLFIFCNAAISATLSTVLDRYSSRVNWVIPFLCMLYLLNRYSHSKQER